MVLYTKCILKEKSKEDGIRISVMSRHTLNDGKTPDFRIGEDSYDEHLNILAPPLKLIGDYYKKGLSWEGFSKKYLDYIGDKDVAPFVRELARRALEIDVTIMCIEDIPDRCHRKLLAEECKRYESLLKVVNL